MFPVEIVVKSRAGSHIQLMSSPTKVITRHCVLRRSNVRTTSHRYRLKKKMPLRNGFGPLSRANERLRIHNNKGVPALVPISLVAAMGVTSGTPTYGTRLT